jgi:sugar fermentation stimulation protein A
MIPVRVPLAGGGAVHEGQFLARPNRFVVTVELDGAAVAAHVADRGRLHETLIPTARVWLVERPGAHRATRYQAAVALVGERRTSIDTLLPNRLVVAALRAGALPAFAGYERIRAEARVGDDRFDVALDGAAGTCLLEVKSAALILDGTAWFPDAPTARGARHLRHLAGHRRAGLRTAVLFVAQGRAARIVINHAIDPAFVQALDDAARAGVTVLGYDGRLDRDGLSLGAPVPVEW